MEKCLLRKRLFSLFISLLALVLRWINELLLNHRYMSSTKGSIKASIMR